MRLWQATNPEARDFRLDTIGRAFQSSPLQPEKNGRYVARVGKPAQGWTAYFVEMTFSGPRKSLFKFTTGLRITPETLPAAPPGRRTRN